MRELPRKPYSLGSLSASALLSRSYSCESTGNNSDGTNEEISQPEDRGSDASPKESPIPALPALPTYASVPATPSYCRRPAPCPPCTGLPLCPSTSTSTPPKHFTQISHRRVSLLAQCRASSSQEFLGSVTRSIAHRERMIQRAGWCNEARKMGDLRDPHTIPTSDRLLRIRKQMAAQSLSLACQNAQEFCRKMDASLSTEFSSLQEMK